MERNNLHTADCNQAERKPGARVVLATSSLLLAIIAALMLVVGVQAAAFSGSPAPEIAPAQFEQVSGADHGEDDNDEAEIKGTLGMPVSTFAGEWVLNVDSSRTVTVVFTATTDVAKFMNRLPSVGDWIEAKGTWLAPDRLEARRVRPDEYEANEVVARLKPGVNAEMLAARYDMTVTGVLSSANIYLFFTHDDEDLETEKLLNDQTNVEWAEVNWISRVPAGSPYRSWRWGGEDDNGYVNQHAFELVNLAPALTQYDGTDMVVAILDTGVDLEHTALKNSLIAGRDMISDTATPNDIGPGLAWGHGTHVAGIVHKMAPASKIMPIRVLDSQGRGNTFVLAYAIEYATQQGADVINLSLGADCGSQVLSATIQSAIAQGVIIVAAAGNDGTEAPQCPASMPGVIAVAAVDENKVRASWSNYGAGWVDMAAPGVGITSTFPGGYASWSGTSMATPFVAGAAALAKQKKENENGTVAVDAMLINRGEDISGLNGEEIGPLLNVAAAVDSLPTEPEPTPPPDRGTNTIFLPSVTK